MPLFANARSYDFYVDASASGDEEGSEDEPFEEISDAIKKAEKKGGRQEIFIADGEYKESFTLSKDIRIYGESEGDVKIIGTVTMEDGSHMEDLTIDGERYAVVVLSGADAEIENCTIEGFEKIGINAEAGGGKLKVTGSKIRKSEGKGFYLQKGKDVSIVGNEVYDNDEEGVDIRSNVDGEIRNNVISDNGESGIEIILSDSDLKITNNNIKNNGASGIATQFYEELDDNGDVDISGNDIHNNSKYGVDCNTPQGGSSGSYWSESMNLENNNFNKNELGNIRSRCDVVSEEEIAEEEATEGDEEGGVTKNEDEKDEKTEAELLAQQKAEEERLFREENERKIREVEARIINQNNIIDSLNRDLEKLNNQSKIKTFFFGVDQDEINNALKSLNEVEGNFSQIEDALNEVHLEQDKDEEIRKDIEIKLEEVHNKEESLNKKKNSFFVFSFLNIFKS